MNRKVEIIKRPELQQVYIEITIWATRKELAKVIDLLQVVYKDFDVDWSKMHYDRLDDC